MISAHPFSYEPGDDEAEKASNSYLMSLVALVSGLPFPIMNLAATAIFFLANRRAPYFVRWHCTQALLSQLSLLAMNSVGVWWTVSIVFGSSALTNRFIAYVLTILLFNAAELIATIYTAIAVRKGRHAAWWFFGEVTNLLCRPDHE